MTAPALTIAPGPALALATSAENAVRATASLALNYVEIGTLAVACTASLTSAVVTAQFVPQVSMDGTNWFDLQTLDQVVRPVAATGTGSLVVTTTALMIPAAAHAWNFFQVIAILGAAATAAGDQTAVAVFYLPVNVNGAYTCIGA